jgi:hypothetical protein
MRILRYNNVCSSDYARCQSQSCHAHGRRRRAQHHHTDTTADPTRCAAHRLLTAVTASVTGGLVAKLRGRYNRTPLHATISHTMTLTTAARRICWRFWQHTGPVMTPPLYTALLSASESPQACQAPAVLVSIGPTAGFNKKNSLKTTPFAFSEGYRLCRGFGVYRNFFIPATWPSGCASVPRYSPSPGRIHGSLKQESWSLNSEYYGASGSSA